MVVGSMLLITTLDKAAPVLTLGSSEEESNKIKLYSSKFLKHLGLSCLPVTDSDGKRTMETSKLTQTFISTCWGNKETQTLENKMCQMK